MKKKIKAELVKLATQIITAEDLTEITGLYDASKEMYEKLAVLKYINDNLNDVEVNVAKSPIAAKFEKMANAVLNENKLVPESNPHEEDIMIPGMDTIKDMVLEMPEDKKVDAVLSEFLEKPNYAKNDKELFMPKANEIQTKDSKSVNDRVSSKEIKVDLNNRLAFVKHLFNDSTEDYNRVLSQLNTIDSEERSVSFIVNMVKPDYNNWEGKEDLEERFMQLIERKFA
ncbi:hypothetical protein CLV91_0971 [Maribacter vaceletii]|uniref:Uncharacterized protein n=1 Tax=Maribacter vaceletii TaxID=1206816 RepID=A0A495EDB4_9FLAO|nr:hypothetical protein [Maribacter vaceletii]RKR14890.1 hypothetical protein CLV91_0971 [Maribacter vaceletii]